LSQANRSSIRTASWPGASSNAIRLGPAEGAALPGSIRSVAYLGDHLEYEVETEFGTLFVVDAAVDEPLAPASRVGIGLESRGLALIAE
jgi:iron(III) transport system ATP-binding protein